MSKYCHVDETATASELFRIGSRTCEYVGGGGCVLSPTCLKSVAVVSSSSE